MLSPTLRLSPDGISWHSDTFCPKKSATSAGQDLRSGRYMRYSCTFEPPTNNNHSSRNMPQISALALKPTPDWALFLDVDGTILHLRDTPDSVEASDALLNLLEAVLKRLEGAVALVSGRSIENLDALFEPHRLPTAGLHGLERRDATGAVHRIPAPDELDALRPPLLELAGSSTKIILEDKGSPYSEMSIEIISRFPVAPGPTWTARASGARSSVRRIGGSGWPYASYCHTAS